MKPNLVIFDFDGVLIDSEVLGSQVWSAELMKYGFNILPKEILEKYTGRSGPQICASIESDTHKKLPVDFLDQVNVAVESLMEHELKAVAGTHNALEKLKIKMCIASGSRPKRLFQCLRVTALDHFFDSKNVFSAHEVKNGKPAPDIFLYAAKKMDVLPDQCLVIEDSVAGVLAGISAGMTVFGFIGGGHCTPDHAEKLRKAGAHLIFDAFDDLLDKIEMF